jgi:hypothetical protein
VSLGRASRTSCDGASHDAIGTPDENPTTPSRFVRPACWIWRVASMQRVHAPVFGRIGALGGAAYLGASVLGALGCGTPRIDKPPAPDMAPLIAAYDAPDAAFDASVADEIALAIALIDELLARTALREQLVDVLADILSQASELSDFEGSGIDLTFEAGGYMRITRVCAGWARPARPDRDANGALLVTATFSQSGLDPLVWGAAEACRYSVGETQIELDRVGTSAEAVRVYWGDAPSNLALRDRTLLVDLNLAATIDGERLPLDLDFRSHVDGTLEYRIPRPDGSLVARVGAGDTVTLRARNGTFDCDAELRCGEPRPAGDP